MTPRGVTTIPLDRPLPAGSSSLPAGSAGRFIACLLGIAPGGGYRVSPFALAEAVSEDSSLWPYSARRRGWSLAITLPCGVRTFLPFRRASTRKQLDVWSASRGASLALLARFGRYAPTGAENSGIRIEGGIPVRLAPSGDAHDGQRAEVARGQIGAGERSGQDSVDRSRPCRRQGRDAHGPSMGGDRLVRRDQLLQQRMPERQHGA